MESREYCDEGCSEMLFGLKKVFELTHFTLLSKILAGRSPSMQFKPNNHDLTPVALQIYKVITALRSQPYLQNSILDVETLHFVVCVR
jgi:hypothetical protein